MTILVGTETMVNTHLPGQQLEPSVAMLKDGGWVVTWQSWGQDGSNDGVYQQRYKPDGTPDGVEVLVNTTTAESQYQPAITALKDGGWLVTWVGDEAGGPEIYQRRYDADGTATTAVGEVVNTDVGSVQEMPTVTALPNGGWVVVWASRNDGAGNGHGIFQQQYDANGDPTTLAQVRVHTTLAGNQTKPSVAVLEDGGWIVTWQSPDADGTGIYQQRFKADGTQEGVETPVNSLTAGAQANAIVTGLKDGGWVVAWQSPDTNGTGIYQQRYDKDGNALGSGETQVNTTSTGDQKNASITALTDGGWVVTWQSANDIYLRHYNSSGTAVGNEVLVNDITASDQEFPSVTALPGGGWVVTWQSFKMGVPGEFQNIVQKTYFGVNDAPTGTNATLTAKENTAYSFKVADFGFSDTNGNSLSGVKITTLPTKGTVLLNGIAITAGQTIAVADITAGKLTWEPPAGEDGTALTTIGFKVIDDGGTDHSGEDIDQTERVITFNVTPTPTTPDTDKGKILIGGDGDDRFTGTNWADLLSGKGGDDHLDGGAGNDTLWGGEDDDLLKGGSGNDILGGGPGADTLFGGGGDDKLYGGKDSGADRLYGGDGKDKLWGGGGNDKLYGGDDDDTLGGGAGDDLLGGGSGNDILYGGAGSDQIYGGTGDDRIHGGPGNDELWGGAGNDIFIFRENTGKDRIMDFTRGQDKIDLSAFSTRTNPLDFNDINIQTTAAGVVVSINGIQVTLEGQKSLNRDDFIL